MTQNNKETDNTLSVIHLLLDVRYEDGKDKDI